MLFGARLIFFPLVWNNINFVLEVLTAILLFLSQLDIFYSSVLTVLIRVGRWESVSMQVVSSANRKVRNLVESGRS